MGQSFEIAVTLLVFETRAVSRESIHQHHTFEMYLIMLFRLIFKVCGTVVGTTINSLRKPQQRNPAFYCSVWEKIQYP